METSSLSFGQPLWLWALWLLPGVAVLFVMSHRRGRALLEKIVASRLRKQLAGEVSVLRRVLRGLLILLALASTIFALAQPRSGWKDIEIKGAGRDVILAIDVSRSMLATDLAPNRLERARLFSRDLLGFLRGDRVGVVAFAGSAFLQAPLTLDQSAVLATLDELGPDLIPRGGSNIAEAIRTSLTAFGSAEGKSRAIVIVADGEEMDADGIAAAREAAEQGVAIFTVGIGSAEGSLIPITNELGQKDFVRDADGQHVLSRLDAARLEEIANVTDGFYLAIGPDAAQQIFMAGIEPMERSETGAASTRQPIQEYQIPAALATSALVLWLLIGDRKWRWRRRKTPTPALSSLAAIVALTFFPAILHASPADALQKYNEGDYKAALDAFQKGAQSGHESAKQLFNAGAAAYRDGQFPKALEHFSQALLSADPQLQEKAAYNLGNSLVRKAETTEALEEKKKDLLNAIDYYEQSLKSDPDNSKATDNIEVVKKMLEELEKEQEQQKQDQQKQDQQKQDQQNQDQQKQDQQNQDQQKQDQQKQDQQNQDQQKQDQQNQDQQNQDQQNQDQQNQDQQNQDQQKEDQEKQDQQNQDQQNQDQQNQDQQNQDQQNQDQQNQDQQNQDQQSEAGSPEEKKEGELKEANEQAEQGADSRAMPEEVEEKDGEMSEAQARALLERLRGEEERVQLQQRLRRQRTIKDW